MFHVARYLSFALCCAVAALFVAGSAGAVDDREGVLVGRVSHVEGKLLRYVEEENDWVLTVKDAPFGLDDALYSGEDAKAEFIMPSGAWMRVGANTQIQLIDMNMDATTLDVASGMARLFNKSRNGVIKATTPFGYVVAPAGSAFDLYVGDESMEVIAVLGKVDFVHDATGSRFPVREGGESIIADRQGTAQGNGSVDGDWDDWNAQRDAVWAEREQSRSRMADLLPEPIREESYVFEDNGRWERVQYEGAYRDMWRPIRVDPGWRPFTVGRWTQYYGDNCWIPDEPFGYVTHHYGSWVYVEAFHSWYWMPPVVRRHPNTPTIFISFGWYPGRVGWIHGRDSVGWVPLAPNEIYYGHRPWGHRTRVINHTTVNIININKYHYLNEAVVVNRDQLYQGSRYTPHLRRDFDRAELAKSFKPMPMAKAFDGDKRRFAYSDAQVGRKPHAMVAERINSNQKISKDAGRINRARIEKDLTRVKASAEPPQKEMRAPTLSSRLVEAGKTAVPIDRAAAPPKEIKPRERERRITPDNRAGFDRPDRRLGDSVEPKRDAAGQEESRRTRAPKDEGNALRNPANVAPQTGGAPQGRREPAALDEGRDAAPQGDQAQERRIRSPRDRESQGPTPDRSPANLDRRRPTDEPQQPVEQGVQQQGPNDALKARQEQAAGRRGPEDVPRRQQEEQGRRRELEAKQQQGEAVQRPRREEAQQLQQQETLRRQQAEEQGKQQELQRRQQEEQGRRQEQEQQRRQGLEAKQRQEDAAQRQQQEVQRRQQAETQQRQQQEMQRRQQAEEQGRQQELQRRQQEEQGRRQEQQRRQELEAKQRQEESAQRQRQEASQQRQQQEAQRRQQEEAQQRQQQEVQRRQQAEEQGRQQQLQRRQQEEAQQRQQQQQQQQQEQRKRRKLTPEEELLLKQSAPNQ